MYNVNHVSLLVYFLMHFIIILKPYFSFENSQKNILCILKCTQGYVIYFRVTSNKNLSLVVVLKAVSTIQVHTSTCKYYIQYHHAESCMLYIVVFPICNWGVLVIKFTLWGHNDSHYKRGFYEMQLNGQRGRNTVVEKLMRCKGLGF